MNISSINILEYKYYIEMRFLREYECIKVHFLRTEISMFFPTSSMCVFTSLYSLTIVC